MNVTCSRMPIRAILHDDWNPDGPSAGRYLVSYDLEANDGHGEFIVSTDPALAFVFLSFREMMAWRQTSPANHPIRENDGKPNRPASRFTIETEAVWPHSAT